MNAQPCKLTAKVRINNTLNLGLFFTKLYCIPTEHLDCDHTVYDCDTCRTGPFCDTSASSFNSFISQSLFLGEPCLLAGVFIC